MDEVKLHLGRARKSLKASKILANDELFEDAASRAYYAMFHAAKALLISRDVVPKTHKGLISKFGEEFVKTHEIDKEKLRELSHGFRMRMKSDYEAEFSLSSAEITLLIEETEDFLKSIEDILEDFSE